MSEPIKRNRRSKEEIVAEYRKKIDFHKNAISSLEEKIERVLNPKPRSAPATQMKTILNKAKETMTPEEIAEKLGIEL